MILQVFVHNPFIWNEPMSYVAWCIRKVTGSDYNHTGVLWDEDEVWWFAHATPDGIIKVKYEDWLLEKFRILDYEELDDTPEARERISSCIGKPYDYENLILHMPYYLLTEDYVGWEQRGAQKFDCYEFVAYVNGDKEYWKAKPTRKFKNLKDKNQWHFYRQLK